LSDQNFSIRPSNTRKHRINVYLEPWGEVYPLEPNKKLRVDAVGPIGVAPNNMLEIGFSKALTHYPCFEHRHDPLCSSSALRRDGYEDAEVFLLRTAPSTGGAVQWNADSDPRVDAG
jgi:hypothetical protein